MKFEVHDLAAGMAEGMRQSDESTLAKAQNLAWEECVSDERREFFESKNFAGRGPSWSALSERHDDYVQLYVITDAVPHTFNTSLKPARLEGLDKDQVVVRLERLERAFENSIYSFDEIQDAHEARDLAILDAFAEEWNAVRDSRPAFATFLREVQHELERPDWPDLLRNRLGLARYQPAGEPIPVAVMSYSVREVLADAGGAVPFTTPTVLDSAPWEHYFPAPRDISYGRAMALTPCDTDEQLVAEILHSRLTYRGRHIRMLGFVRDRSPIVPLATLRSHHLLALQLASGREDFGQ
ncbi:MAG: hypothetical protein JOZ90_03430 [Alphaproteobacteria bacterium]|nr:hypothetical protein [Alphaproteobacteria bacterium]MBV9370788.1 hypothetical protein [Alphaproteobacteria bacterium]MBV9900132.1 hypothetical protein [Alphaproteobacteria bacterium]